MTRHIIDNHQTLQSSKRAAVFVKRQRQQLRQSARRKLLEHSRLTGNGRLVQYLMIERGRIV